MTAIESETVASACREACEFIERELPGEGWGIRIGLMTAAHVAEGMSWEAARDKAESEVAE